MFVIPKNGGGWRLIIDLRYLTSYLEPLHFKMEGLYMLPTILKGQWQMAKIDLRDAYLTIPVVQEHHCLLPFKVPPDAILLLPFGLCFVPFVFSKVTKPIGQFLRQLGD